MKEAVSAFCVEMGEISAESKLESVYEGDFLNTVWETDKDKLELHTLKSAQPFKINMYEDKQFINGRELFVYIENK